MLIRKDNLIYEKRKDVPEGKSIEWTHFSDEYVHWKRRFDLGKKREDYLEIESIERERDQEKVGTENIHTRGRKIYEELQDGADVTGYITCNKRKMVALAVIVSEIEIVKNFI